MQTLNLSPIGYLRNKDQSKFSVPHQSIQHQSATSNGKGHYIELLNGHNFEAALKDLKDFDRIWIIWWFNKNTSWRPCVLPARGKAQKRGVFATRSPHRPNPVGISCVNLISIKGRKIYISDSDLIDGTPVFDIKPYIPEVDSFPDSRAGWVDQLEIEQQYEVTISDLAAGQAKWLKDNFQIDFLSKAKSVLSIDPSPHRTRRISKLKDGNFRMGCGAWRVLFSLEKNRPAILSLAPGYPLRALNDKKLTEIIDREAQLAFYQIWL